MWQETGVVLIVAGAVVFLLRRFGLLRGRAARGTETFVPLASVKKASRTDRGDDRGGGCH